MLESPVEVVEAEAEAESKVVGPSVTMPEFRGSRDLLGNVEDSAVSVVGKGAVLAEVTGTGMAEGAAGSGDFARVASW